MTIYYCANYVTVSDLITNGGEGCTVLSKRPYTDHITIVETGNTSMGRVIICHGKDILVLRETKKDSLDSQRLTIVDLHNARIALFKRRMCYNCIYYGYNHLCKYGTDNWRNYRECTCPCKEDW